MVFFRVYAALFDILSERLVVVNVNGAEVSVLKLPISSPRAEDTSESPDAEVTRFSTEAF
jgi:hypothetical protein